MIVLLSLLGGVLIVALVMARALSMRWKAEDAALRELGEPWEDSWEAEQTRVEVAARIFMDARPPEGGQPHE